MLNVCAGVWTLVLLVAACGAASDKSELFAAAQDGELARVRQLLDAGVDVNAKSEYGATALSFASDKGHVAIVKLLLERGADPNVKDSFYNATPITWASMNKRFGVLRLLIEHGADGAKAVLMPAIQAGEAELVAVILKKAEFDAATLRRGLSAARRRGNAEIVKLLEDAGASSAESTVASVSAAVLERYAGTYKSAQIGMSITFRTDDGKLKGRVTGQAELTYAPKDETTFEAVEVPGIKFTFNVDGEKVPSATLAQGGRTFVFERAAADVEKKPDAKRETRQPESPVAVTKPANWPQFRGPGASGVADGQHPPARWDVRSGHNVRWKTPIPGFAHASPIVWGERVFIVSASSDEAAPFRHGLYGDVAYAKDFDKKYAWVLYCLDKKSGGILWQRTGYEGMPKIKRHLKASHANSTPATDGERVVTIMGSDLLCCYDMDGKLLWKTDVGLLDAGWFYDAEYQWGFGSSPIIYKNLVILQADIQSSPFIAAYDLATGKPVWKTPRDEVCSWSSPNVFEVNGRAELVTNGTHAIRAYDPLTGKELWRLVGNSEVCVPTPILAHGLVYLTSGYAPIQPIYAIKPGGSGDISLTDGKDANEHVAWSKQRGGPYMQTPIVYGDYLYTCNDRGILTCYDAKTGEQEYRQRLGGGGAFTASSVAADGRLYFTSEDGEVMVVKAGPEFEKISQNDMDEVCLATPAISDGMIFIRTQHSVFGIGYGQSAASGAAAR